MRLSEIKVRCPACGVASPNEEWEHSEVTYDVWCTKCGARSDMREVETVADKKVYCVTLDGVLYDIFSTKSGAEKRRDELQGDTVPKRIEDKYMVETWEVEDGD